MVTWLENLCHCLGFLCIGGRLCEEAGAKSMESTWVSDMGLGRSLLHIRSGSERINVDPIRASYCVP